MGLMFCRYCGAHILEDSLFCAKCGKRLGNRSNPRMERLVTVLRLNTPYPYAIILFSLVASYFALQPKKTFDYSQTKWSIEMDRKLDVPDDHLFRDSLSLVVENTGTKSIKGIPIELKASIEPAKLADVKAAFPGDQELLIKAGKAQPVDIVLNDSIPAGSKRRYVLDGSVQAIPPFKVTFLVLKDDTKTVLASYVLER
jgi:hypothetical protein